MNFNIPIIFIFFKRKDTTLKVFEVIRKIKPKKIYLFQYGPRNEEEKEKILDVRKGVLSKIDWECNLKTNFQEKNLGLIDHIPFALDKFFKENEYGIYLEDDTLPSLNFFKFQKELLPKYKNDNRIFCINGTNFFPNKLKTKDFYFLSQIPNIWGCGLYKRSWELYEKYPKNFEKILNSKNIKDYIFSEKFKYYTETYISAINKGKLNTWDIQIVFTMIKNRMYAITPSTNLINNIGFLSKEATNKFISNYYYPFEKKLSIKHPKKLIYKKENDIIYFNNLLQGGWLRLIAIRIYLFSPKILKKIIEFFAVNILRKLIS